jgi:hypothetical protein
MQAAGLDFPPWPQVTIVFDGVAGGAVNTVTLKSPLLSSN